MVVRSRINLASTCILLMSGRGKTSKVSRQNLKGLIVDSCLERTFLSFRAECDYITLHLTILMWVSCFQFLSLYHLSYSYSMHIYAK